MALTTNEITSILNFTSALIIGLGLPLGFYLVFTILDPIDHLKTASSAIGEGFIRGMQNGVNETALNELVRKLTNTVVDGINPAVNELYPAVNELY